MYCRSIYYSSITALVIRTYISQSLPNGRIHACHCPECHPTILCNSYNTSVQMIGHSCLHLNELIFRKFILTKANT